jgi:nucleotide-binding universal stress UspA family protein
MLRILLAIDGSESSDRAVAHLLKKLDWYKERPEIHLLNVQAALPADVSRFISAEQLQDFHRERAEAALASAKRLLDSAQVGFVTHVAVGEPAHVIAHYAGEKAADQIVMGTRGLGSVAGLMMGSVTAKVISLTDIPVLLIK